MSNDDDVSDWVGSIYQTGEVCPIKGYWEQVETGQIIWHEKGDRFTELNPAPNYQRATYKYIGLNKGGIL